MAVVTQRGVLPSPAPLSVKWSWGRSEWRNTNGPATRASVSVLSGIGIDNLGAGGERSALDAKVDGLSGGERRRVALAAALVQDPRPAGARRAHQPTSTSKVFQWLAEHLVSRRSALVVVTHDRWFLDTVATRTWEVVGGGVEKLRGWLQRLGVRSRPSARVRLTASEEASTQPCAQGTRMAAPRCAGPYVQAEVPHRGRRGPDRRRSGTS